MKPKHLISFYASTLFVVFIFFLLNSCQPTTIPFTTATSNAPSSTTTPSATSTITSTPCPFVTPFPTLTTAQTKLIYVLIDRSGSYGAYTQPAVEMLIESLTLAVEPGDSIYLVWLGENEDPNNYLWHGNVPTVNAPILTPPVPTLTPAPTLTLTPVATVTLSPTSPSDAPVGTKSILQEQLESQAATVDAITATSIAATATQAAVETFQAHAATSTYGAIIIEQDVHEQKCLQLNANHENRLKLEVFEESKNTARLDFINNNLLPILTATVSANDGETHIYNSLFIASRVIQTERGKNSFSSYYLLIFSDMLDAGSIEGKKLEVNLQGVNVLVAMMYCDKAIHCQERENDWRDYFISKNAILPPYAFKLIQETTPDLISDFLRR